MEPDSLLTTGGSLTALLGFAALAIKYAIEFRGERRAEKRDDVKAALPDAATTNAILLASLQRSDADGISKDARIDFLESALDRTRTQMYAEREDYERRLVELRAQLVAITHELDDIQSRLHTEQK